MKIRTYEDKDTDQLVELWYEASVKAHWFIPAEMWVAHKGDLRNIYLPSSETWVVEEQGQLQGFISLMDDYIGALFVAPRFQGQGVGTLLMEHAKALKGRLTVGVYKQNEGARRFYETNGFAYLSEELQEETGELIVNMEYTPITL